MSVYKGKLMRLKLGTKQLKHEVSCKLSISKDFNELTSKDISGKTSTPGSYTWSVAVDTLVEDSAAAAQEDLASLTAALLADTLYAAVFTSDVSGEIMLSGNVYVQSADVDATNEEGVTASFNFKGDGDLTIATVA